MKKIVIIGGGFAGSTLARKLEKRFKVTLIDTKDYFEFTPGILRTIVEPNHIKKIQVKHLSYLKKATLVVGRVKEVSNDFIKIKNRKIMFDYLCICSGSKYNAPIKEQNVVLATRASHLKESHEKMHISNKIVIIGAGLVGVELAAEISTHYKDKEITLIESNARIMPKNTEKASIYAEKFLKKNNVRIINNERIIHHNGENMLTTSKNRKIEADITFLCTGIAPNFEFMEKNFSSSLTERKFINVSPDLRIEGTKNIFALGDINSLACEKTAQNAEKQANLVVRNILHLERGESPEEYISKKRPLVISLGKRKGILEINNNTITGILPALLKKLIEKKEMFKLKFL